MEQMVTQLEVAEDGTLTIPSELVHQLQLSPHQPVTVTIQEGKLVLQRNLSEREKFERMGQLLREGLKGVEWSEIEEGRRH